MSILQTITNSLSKRLILQSTGNGIQQNYMSLIGERKTTTTTTTPVRCIWGYVAIAFNQVDKDRLARVGPNRLCAEWVLKNGGGVRFTENPSRLWTEYNLLPSESTPFRLKVVDASNASVMKIGLQHFEGCKNIDTVIFHNCKHLESDSLEGLTLLSGTLTSLQVSGCHNISDSGLIIISELKNLQQLIIFDMPYVRDMDSVAAFIRKSLPHCDIKATKLGPKFMK